MTHWTKLRTYAFIIANSILISIAYTWGWLSASGRDGWLMPAILMLAYVIVLLLACHEKDN